MNIIKFQGGLGNQMFQYALYRRFQLDEIPVKADLLWYMHNRSTAERKIELAHFPIELKTCSKMDAYIRNNTFTRVLFKHFDISLGFYRERMDGYYDESIMSKRNIFLTGYWQTEKYFSQIRKQLLVDFTFPKTCNEWEMRMEQQIWKSKAISIHIRRGDYLNNVEVYGNICTEEYYKKAIRYIRKHVQEPVFFVFSDDVEWSKKFLAVERDMVFVENPDRDRAIMDMYFMSICCHNIIANSSFSWWASWLNQNENKIVVAPARWINNSETPDIYCESWVRL